MYDVRAESLDTCDGGESDILKGLGFDDRSINLGEGRELFPL